jgi:hypothetical protein
MVNNQTIMHLSAATARKWLLLAVGGTVFYLSFDLWGDFLYKQMLGNNPEVILAAINGAKITPSILTRVGDIHSEKSNLKMSPNQDSLVFQIELEGNKSSATIEAHAVKQVSGVWKIYQSDTLFTD